MSICEAKLFYKQNDNIYNDLLVKTVEKGCKKSKLLQLEIWKFGNSIQFYAYVVENNQYLNSYIIYGYIF